MAFKCQKWRLTFSKFHKTILAFKTPKCDVFISNIGVINAKKRSILNPHILAFKFYEMDTWSSDTTTPGFNDGEKQGQKHPIY